MSRIVRWDPFREIRSMMNTWPTTWDLEEDFSMGLAVDMSEDDNNVYIEADLPGFNSDDVDITVTADQVTIKAERTEEQKEETKTYLRKERRWGHVSRTIALPTPVINEGAEAEFADGTLKLTLPKVEEVRPKQIQVKVKSKED